MYSQINVFYRIFTQLYIPALVQYQASFPLADLYREGQVYILITSLNWFLIGFRFVSYYKDVECSTQ